MKRIFALIFLFAQAYAAEHVQFGTPAGGDLSGTYPNPSVNPSALGSGSTNYIQNTLTPTTTTQAFSVQIGTITDSFQAGNASAVMRFDGMQTDPLLELDDAPAGPPGGAVNFNNSSRVKMASLARTSNTFDLNVSSSSGLTPTTRLNIQNSGQISFQDNSGSSMATMVGSSVTIRGGRRLLFNDSGDANYVAFKASNTLAGSTLFVLPNGDGSAGQALLTDGGRSLYFGSVTGGSGSSSLAVTTGTVSGFSAIISSPTAVINADQAMFAVSLQGGSTAFMTLKHTVTSVSANTVLTSTHSVVLADATGGGITVTLPTAVGISGRIYTVKRTNSGANTVTINTTSAQTIDGDSTAILSVQHTSVDLVSDGANWRIL